MFARDAAAGIRGIEASKVLFEVALSTGDGFAVGNGQGKVAG